MKTRWVAAALLLLCQIGVADAQSLADLPQRDLLDRIDENPEDGAARLEFARREFAARRDASAGFNARQALNSGHLSAEDAAAAREILSALQRRRRWIFNFDAALAPATSRQEFVDSNPDNDTDDDVILETRESGVGITGFGSVENRIAISQNVRWSTQVFARSSIFIRSNFNTVFLAGRFGPLLLQDGDDRIGVRGILESRWLGGEKEFDAYGAEAFVQRSLTDRLVGFGRLTARSVDDRFNSRDGETYAVDGVLTRFGAGGRFERVFGLVFRADLESSNQSFWFLRAGFGVFRETAYGLGILVEPSVSYQAFNGIDARAGFARTDWRYGGTVRVVKRDWRLFGTSPFVSLGVEQQASNIDAFDTTRTTVNAGLTRTF